MVEVFKTNVDAKEHAEILLERIHALYTGCRATFDLEDSDRVLRVQCDTETVCPNKLISLLQQHGCCANLLTDDVSL